jgi:hypothetical protein
MKRLRRQSTTVPVAATDPENSADGPIESRSQRANIIYFKLQLLYYYCCLMLETGLLKRLCIYGSFQLISIALL